MTEKRKTIKKTKYKITLKVLGKEWKQEGSTALSALKKFKLKATDIRGRGEIHITKGKKGNVHLLNGAQLRRVFANKILMESKARSLEYLLKEDFKNL